MTDAMPDDLWRDFPKTAPAFEARFKTEEDCRAYWIKARWGGKPACAKCRVDARVDDPQGHDVRVRGLRPSDVADVGHGAGEDAQASEDVVPRDLRDLDAAHRHLGQGPAAHHGLRLLRDGVDVAAQAALGDGALGQRAARPFCRDGRGAGGRQGRPAQATRSGGGGKGRPRAPRPRRKQ